MQKVRAPPPTVSDCQDAPPLAVWTTRPPTPTTTQLEVDAVLSPNTPIATACWFHEAPPLVVARMGPSSPAAKHVVAVGQLIADRLAPLGSGFCQFQTPPSVMAEPSGVSGD